VAEPRRGRSSVPALAWPRRYYLSISSFDRKRVASVVEGLVPAVLAGKVALAKAARVGESLGVEMAPIFGVGALPFRGHVTLEGLDGVLETFPGLRTVTIQLALRYDHGEEATRAVVTRLRERLVTGVVAGLDSGPPVTGPDSATRSPASCPPAFTPAELDQLYNFIAIFTRPYLEARPALWPGRPGRPRALLPELARGSEASLPHPGGHGGRRRRRARSRRDPGDRPGPAFAGERVLPHPGRNGPGHRHRHWARRPGRREGHRLAQTSLANKMPPTGTPPSLAGIEFPARSRPGPGRAQPPPRQIPAPHP
jgi:hypothetical protein